MSHEAKIYRASWLPNLRFALGCLITSSITGHFIGVKTAQRLSVCYVFAAEKRVLGSRSY